MNLHVGDNFFKKAGSTWKPGSARERGTRGGWPGLARDAEDMRKSKEASKGGGGLCFCARFLASPLAHVYNPFDHRTPLSHPHSSFLSLCLLRRIVRIHCNTSAARSHANFEFRAPDLKHCGTRCVVQNKSRGRRGTIVFLFSFFVYARSLWKRVRSKLWCRI